MLNVMLRAIETTNRMNKNKMRKKNSGGLKLSIVRTAQMSEFIHKFIEVE